jgi:Endonuclease/Exonuclease/phosphatase family
VVVRIGTWNVENFARPGALDGGPIIDAAYNAKLASLADAITALDPDVLAVQEVGDPAALQDLANKLAGYAHVATADPDGRGIRVGYLSKLELTGVRQVATFPAPLRPIQVDDTPATEGAMGRPALVARITTPAASPSTWSPATSSRSCSPFPVVRSAPATRVCAPATTPTPSSAAPPKPSLSATPPPNCWLGRVSSVRS